jgi:hypothetical protein
VDGAYSPRRPTGVIFSGVGTAGAYQAGVLRALTEAGLKIDVLAGHGVGAMTALAGAIDGGARLWEAGGPWTGPAMRRAYRWRTALRVAGWGLLSAVAVLLSPLLVMVFAAATYAASLVLALVNLTEPSARLVEMYRWTIDRLFLPPWIPTIVPRGLVLTLLVVVGVLLVAALRAAAADRSRRRLRGGIWWRLVAVPLDAREPSTTLVDTLWRLVRGAADTPRPDLSEVSRRYADLLADNLGQPGFREVVIAVHDVDARRDLVGALLQPGRRPAFDGRQRLPGPREAEALDLAGPHRDLTAGLLMGALRLPVVSAPHELGFPSDSYWRGESHRVCDRPELTQRLVEELATIGVEQIILVSAAAPPAVPHGLRSRPLDLRGRLGEYVRSIETAALRDALAAATGRVDGVFVIRPDHNPIGPFDFSTSYDEASDRACCPDELLDRGYADAYRQFIEPAVAKGERQAAS